MRICGACLRTKTHSCGNAAAYPYPRLGPIAHLFYYANHKANETELSFLTSDVITMGARSRDMETGKRPITGRAAAGPFLVLEGSAGFSNDLIEIKTSEKEDSMGKLRGNLADWLSNSNFKKYQKEKIDLAIVVFASPSRYLRQDCDNIAKVILDAISNNPRNKKPFYLIDNDNQVIRLLVYKLQRETVQDALTDGMVLSFRIHDPAKQMILVDQIESQKSAEAFKITNSDSVTTSATKREDGTKFFQVKAQDKI